MGGSASGSPVPRARGTRRFGGRGGAYPTAAGGNALVITRGPGLATPSARSESLRGRDGRRRRDRRCPRATAAAGRRDPGSGGGRDGRGEARSGVGRGPRRPRGGAIRARAGGAT